MWNREKVRRHSFVTISEIRPVTYYVPELQPIRTFVSQLSPNDGIPPSALTRKLNAMEKYMHFCHQQNMMIIRFVLNLASREPLKEKDLETALNHLQRKVPTLQLCIRARGNGELWFCKRDNGNIIDYKSEDPSLFDKIHDEILYQKFDCQNGPLWRARLFQSTVPDLPMNYQVSEEQKVYPYKYKLLFAFHHAITDGASNMRIFSCLIQILNDLIDGKEISDELVGTQFSSNEEDDIMENVLSALVQNRPKLKFLKNYYDYIESIDMKFIKAYPTDSPHSSATETVHYALSVKDTEDFFRKCKLEGVTVNSAICTAINAAVVEMLQNKGLRQDTYEIPLRLEVNLRRYWRKQLGTCLGAAISVMSMAPEAPADIQQNFWENARIFNSEVKRLLYAKAPYREHAVNKLTTSKELKMAFNKDPRRIWNYLYIVGNLGNLDLKSDGQHVQVVDLSAKTSFRDMVSIQEFQTFRGIFTYNLHYGTNYLSREIAQLWIDTIFRILHRVCNEN